MPEKEFVIMAIDQASVILVKQMIISNNDAGGRHTNLRETNISRRAHGHPSDRVANLLPKINCVASTGAN